MIRILQLITINNDYRARYYDPKVGRFVTKDPIGFGGGDVNLYNYVGANPVNLGDPMGLINWPSVGEGALSLIGGGAAVVGGAYISTTGVGALIGVPSVIAGSYGIGWGISQITGGLLDQEIPNLPETIIKTYTEPGLTQDGLIGIKDLVDMLIGKSPYNAVGKLNDVIQNSKSIYDSGKKIKDKVNPCPKK